jgi:hypothetical protein
MRGYPTPTTRWWAVVLLGLVAVGPAGAQPAPGPYADPYTGPGPYDRLPELFREGPPVMPAPGNGHRNGTGNGRGPVIPEPMVFDMVRPLGARKGELEVNTLGLVPLRRERGSPAIEWAPELEYAIWDGFAVEFEFPFGDGRFEAYKFAAQYTFGSAFDDRFIHGTQGIVLYDRDRRGTVLSLLYIWGLRFDEKTSMLGMVGMRTEFAPNTFGRRTGILVDPDEAADEATTIGERGGSRTETLLILTLFREVNERLTFGFEANYARGLEGEGSLLLMPQVHWDFAPKWELQFGVGCQSIAGSSIALAAFRLIREW